jgi:alanine racemase/UDP-N-acetylmuramoyl-tripeptide--D-alanyl-D-alanine ligase
MAVLKALAYGTDLVNLAARLPRFGIHQLGVSATSEGIAIRRRGYGQDIYVFLPDIDDIGSLMRYQLTPILHSAEMIDAFVRQTARSEGAMNVHLKVNTGMNRMGVAPEQALRLADRIHSSGTLKLTGVCTHFGAADEPAHDESTREQIAVFDRILSSLRSAGFSDLDIHAANTGATIRFPEAHYNMVRIGIGLYGIHSSAALPATLELTLAIGVTSRIASIQPCARGQRIGYGYSYRTERDILVATVPFGYDDGIPWRAIANGHVLVNGQRAPIVGRVSMDQMQIDVTDVDGVGVGAEVLLYGQHGGHTLRPEEVAEAANTIPHELLTRLGRRVHRVYVEP